QSYQLKNLLPASYNGIFNIETRKIIRLEYDREVLRLSDNDSVGLILANNQAEIAQYSKNVRQEQVAYLVTVSNGERTPLKVLKDQSYYISPEGKYLIYYDKLLKNYFSYEIATKITRNITKGISVQWSLFQEDRLK